MHSEDCAIHDEGPCTCGTEEELDSIAMQEELESIFIEGGLMHSADCAIHDGGPCTCGAEEELESIALEEGR